MLGKWPRTAGRARPAGSSASLLRPSLVPQSVVVSELGRIQQRRHAHRGLELKNVLGLANAVPGCPVMPVRDGDVPWCWGLAILPDAVGVETAPSDPRPVDRTSSARSRHGPSGPLRSPCGFPRSPSPPLPCARPLPKGVARKVAVGRSALLLAEWCFAARRPLPRGSPN